MNYVPQICPKCHGVMKSIGNLSGQTFTTSPPQWDETFVCHKDRLRRVVRTFGTPHALNPAGSDYELVT